MSKRNKSYERLLRLVETEASLLLELADAIDVAMSTLPTSAFKAERGHLELTSDRLRRHSGLLVLECRELSPETTHSLAQTARSYLGRTAIVLAAFTASGMASGALEDAGAQALHGVQERLSDAEQQTEQLEVALMDWEDADVDQAEGSVIEDGAIVKKGVILGFDSVIETGAIVMDGVTIGNEAVIESHAVVLSGATIGDGAVIESGATVLGNVTVGPGAVVHDGQTVAALDGGSITVNNEYDLHITVPEEAVVPSKPE